MPIPKNGLAQHYDVDPSEYFYAHNEDHKRKSASRLLDELQSLTKTGKLLDVGSGRGELVLVARERGWEVTCVEPSPSFAAVLQARGVDVITSGIEDCSLGSDRFDAVILSAVLEHLYQPQLALQKISASLRSGGLLFLDVPNEGGLYFRAGNLYEQVRFSGSTVNLSPTFSPFHVFGFTPKSLKAILQKNSLAPIVWRVYAGKSCLVRKPGFRGAIESWSVEFIIRLSSFGDSGGYIEAWARKRSERGDDQKQEERALT
jgi:SAM-dependent methyltransferase